MKWFENHEVSVQISAEAKTLVGFSHTFKPWWTKLLGTHVGGRCHVSCGISQGVCKIARHRGLYIKKEYDYLTENHIENVDFI